MISLLIGLAGLGVLFIVGHLLARGLVRRHGVRTALIVGLVGAPLAAALGIPLAILNSRLTEPSFLAQSFVGAAPSWGFLFGFLVGFYRAFRGQR